MPPSSLPPLRVDTPPPLSLRRPLREALVTPPPFLRRVMLTMAVAAAAAEATGTATGPPCTTGKMVTATGAPCNEDTPRPRTPASGSGQTTSATSTSLQAPASHCPPLGHLGTLHLRDRVSTSVMSHVVLRVTPDRDDISSSIMASKNRKGRLFQKQTVFNVWDVTCSPNY